MNELGGSSRCKGELILALKYRSCKNKQTNKQKRRQVQKLKGLAEGKELIKVQGTGTQMSETTEKKKNKQKKTHLGKQGNKGNYTVHFKTKR